MRPLGIDLFCGLGGWTEGLLAEGYDVVGFDNEQHAYGQDRYPAQLVLQDVLSLHGRQFRDAALIVASPPCQAYSYRAMPWKRAKALPPPSNELFDACFRIQLEASVAAGRYIPLVVENVKGAQPWVGRSRWNFGSFHLWGDVPALMPIVRRASKNGGGSWSGVAHNTVSGCSANPVKGADGHTGPMRRDPRYLEPQGPEGVKAAGQNWSRHRRTGEVSPHWRLEGQKVGDQNSHRRGAGPSPHFTNPAEGVKHHASGAAWFDSGPAAFGSKSSARKAASARIAKIPIVLSRHIAAAWKP